MGESALMPLIAVKKKKKNPQFSSTDSKLKSSTWWDNKHEQKIGEGGVPYLLSGKIERKIFFF